MGASKLFPLLLHREDLVRLVLAVERDHVLWRHFQIAHRVKGVHHQKIVLGIQSYLFGLVTQTHNVDSLSTQRDEIFILSKQEPIDLGFPELKALMLLKRGSFPGRSRQILHKDGISINIDGFVPNNQFLVVPMGVCAPRDRDSCISDFETMPPHSQELVDSRVSFREFDQEKANLPIFLVC